MKLGTERHRYLVKGIDDLNAIGCFALTGSSICCSILVANQQSWAMATMLWRWKLLPIGIRQRKSSLLIPPRLYLSNQSVLQDYVLMRLGSIGLRIRQCMPNGQVCIIVSVNPLNAEFDSVVVFAQLHIHGKHEGIHAFLVRIREEDMSVSPGVVIEDMGHKVFN